MNTKAKTAYEAVFEVLHDDGATIAHVDNVRDNYRNEFWTTHKGVVCVQVFDDKFTNVLLPATQENSIWHEVQALAGFLKG